MTYVQPRLSNSQKNRTGTKYSRPITAVHSPSATHHHRHPTSKFQSPSFTSDRAIETQDLLPENKHHSVLKAKDALIGKQTRASSKRNGSQFVTVRSGSSVRLRRFVMIIQLFACIVVARKGREVTRGCLAGMALEANLGGAAAGYWADTKWNDGGLALI